MSSRPPRTFTTYRAREVRQRRLRRRRRLAGTALLLVVVAAVTGAVLVLTRGTSAEGNPVQPPGVVHGGSTVSPSAALTASPSFSPSPTATPSPTPSPSPTWTGPASSKLRLTLKRVITGRLTPKSVVATQTGLVTAQNMIYSHTVSVFNDRTFKLVKTVPDTVRLSHWGFKGYTGIVRGGPVEAAVSADRQSVYVSNYSMYGPGFSRPGDDVGSPGQYDRSFVYRINLARLRIDQVIRVGSVPKFLATTPDGKYLLVSNWTSYSLSVVSVARARQVREIYLGPYPRGIAVDPRSRYAYVAVMGSTNIARVDLHSFKVSWLRGVGVSPRHLCMDATGRWLYVTLNGEGRVGKIDLHRDRVVAKVATGSQPRSMAIAPDGKSLYLVNYDSNTVSKIRCADMHVLQVVSTHAMPIGITYVDATHDLWVSCYSGVVMVFHDG
jgi:YVTN family beta-propeller protein